MCARVGFGEPRIVPYHALAIDPASPCLHYGVQCFEGMKAYKVCCVSLSPPLSLCRVRVHCVCCTQASISLTWIRMDVAAVTVYRLSSHPINPWNESEPQTPPPHTASMGGQMLYIYYITSIGGKGIMGWEILSVGTRVRICTRVYVHTRLYAHFRALSSTNLKLRVCIYSNTETHVHTRINRMPMVPSDFSDLT